MLFFISHINWNYNTRGIPTWTAACLTVWLLPAASSFLDFYFSNNLFLLFPRRCRSVDNVANGAVWPGAPCNTFSYFFSFAWTQKAFSRMLLLLDGSSILCSMAVINLQIAIDTIKAATRFVFVNLVRCLSLLFLRQLCVHYLTVWVFSATYDKYIWTTRIFCLTHASISATNCKCELNAVFINNIETHAKCH